MTTPLLRSVAGLLELAVSDRRYRQQAWAALECLPISLDAALMLGRAMHLERGERWEGIKSEWDEWQASRTNRLAGQVST